MFFLEAALSEMESVLLSVAKQRRAQRKRAVFVDALLQSSLTERQVNQQEEEWPHLRQIHVSQVSARCHGYQTLKAGVPSFFSLSQIMEDCMVFTLAGCSITASCKSRPSLHFNSLFGLSMILEVNPGFLEPVVMSSNVSLVLQI